MVLCFIRQHICLAALLFCSGQLLIGQGVNWVPFDTLADSLRAQPRPVLIFIHTNWCKYCALQEHNTFAQAAVSQMVNENYYALRLDAETAEDIQFLNRTYHGRSQDYHELAEILGKQDGQLAFPTTVVLSKTLQLEKRWVGFVPPETLLVSGQ